MQFPFTKMQGTGNEILVVDGRCNDLSPPAAAAIRRLGDATSGPGFDQLMWLAAPAGDAVASYRVFNNDGSEVEQCGNGLRCVARWLAGEGSATLHLESPAGPVTAEVLADGDVAVDMGPPRFEPADVPFIADARQSLYELDVEGQHLEVAVLSMGNPHCVLTVPDVADAPVETLGPAIEHHPRFPRRTNVGFMNIVNRETIDLRVWERGVGETRACGTGAAAAVVSGQARGRLGPEVTVRLPGGRVVVSSRGEHIWLTGNADWISEGSVDL